MAVADSPEMTKPARKIRMDSLFIGGLYFLLSLIMGRVSALMRAVYQGFAVPANWHNPLWNLPHVTWTLPVALIVLSLLIVKDRFLVRTKAHRINVAAFGLIVLTFCIWFIAVLSPIWTMRQMK